MQKLRGVVHMSRSLVKATEVIVLFLLLCLLPCVAVATGPTLTVPPLQPATQGQVYSSTDGSGNGGAIINIVGACPTCTAGITSGSLPPGLSMSVVTPNFAPDGLVVLNGTPTVGGSYTFTVQVTDNASNTASQSVTFIVNSTGLPVFSALGAANVTPTSETITWTTNISASSQVCYEQTYAVVQCSVESDTGGVTSHSVTLTSLWPGWNYQYYVVSRGINAGAPVDWLRATDSDSTGCCNDQFTMPAAASAGTYDFTIVGVGPHNILQSYPMYVGVYLSPFSGISVSNGLKVQVTGICTFCKVHWPDQQDNGIGSGSVSTQATTDDTLTVFGINGPSFTQFEILTNVGGTTPVGSYTLTVTGTGVPTGGGIASHNFTWPMGVSTASFVPGSPVSYPAIPQKTLWETNMTTPWPGGNDYWYKGLFRDGSACAPGFDQCIPYYDGIWAYYQIGTYTNNHAHWDTGANNSRAIYRDNYITPNSGGLPGRWIFPHGLYYDCVTNGNTGSCTALHQIAANGAGANLFANSLAGYDAVNARESCFQLGAHRLDFKRGGGSTLAQVKQLVAYCVGHIDQVVNATTNIEQAFFDGLMAQALLDYYNDPSTGNQSDVRIPTAIQALADHLWTTLWLPWSGTNGYFIYNLFENNTGIIEQGCGQGCTLQDLNLLIAPMYAWLYLNTGQTKYQLEGDTIWASGVQSPTSASVGWSGKNFSQTYRWSFDFVRWRTASFTSPPGSVAATGLNATPPYQVYVTWGASSASSPTYNVYRTLSPGNYNCAISGTWPQIASGISVTNFTDTSVGPGTWCYEVTAVSGGIESAPDTPGAAVVPPQVVVF